MPGTSQVLRDGRVPLRDGRTLAYATWGDPRGRPLLRIHGTPGSRFGRHPDAGLYTRIAAHVVTFDRPGYGESSAHRARTLQSVADDALELVNALGWDRFSVLGGSGGGPHALALGLRAPERILRLGIVGGAAPDELVGDTDLTELNREGRRRARQGRASLEAFMAGPAKQMMADPAGMMAAAMKDAPDIDRRMLQRPEVQAVLVEQLREGFRHGPAGWFDDAWVLTREWGFDLEAVRVPVWVWHGELDRTSPLTAARQMAAQLRAQSFKVVPGQGHLCAITEEEDILGTLLT